MKEAINKIRVELDKLIQIQNSSLLKDQELIVKELIEEAFYLLFDSPDLNTSFNTMLNVFVLKKISLRIDELSKLLPPLILRGNGKDERIIKSLSVFKNSLIRSYFEQLKGSSEFERYKDEEIDQNSSMRDFLINPNYSYEGDEFLENIPFKHFKKLIDKGYDETLTVFKKLFDSDNDKENSKIQLTRFITEIDDKFDRISKAIIAYNERLSYLRSSLTDEGTIEHILEDGSVITVDVFENNLGEIMEVENELSNEEYLKEKILNFREYALKCYPFLSNTISNNVKTDVFGSFNYDRLIKLYEEFNFFFRKETSSDKFIDVFTSFEEYSNSKIDLVSGIQADYGSIIRKMYTHFSASNFSKKSEYDKWWSDRFTFDGIDKSPTDVGRIKTMKSSKNTSKIIQILAVLE